jgi:hypothetical protein
MAGRPRLSACPIFSPSRNQAAKVNNLVQCDFGERRLLVGARPELVFHIDDLTRLMIIASIPIITSATDTLSMSVSTKSALPLSGRLCYVTYLAPAHQ